MKASMSQFVTRYAFAFTVMFMLLGYQNCSFSTQSINDINRQPTSVQAPVVEPLVEPQSDKSSAISEVACIKDC
ncbi:MAG: hypothetical protein SGI74_09925 [Oligoflexia bacterium]|nr:hypothetical protein [Oligoflexia bacterium]